MRTELRRDVSVIRYEAFAEMAWLERRLELGTICALARDSERTITSAVVEQALPGVEDVGAANLTRWCAQMGLCDRSGALSALGEDAAETNEVPIPEQGVYSFWVVSDPLLGSRALHVERLASSADGRFADIAPITVQPDAGKPFVSLADGRTRFLVRSFPSNHGTPGGIQRPTSAQCRVRWLLDWELERTEFRLEGTIDTASGGRAIQHIAERVELDLWGLMDSWAMGPLRAHGYWSARDRSLSVPFDSVREAPQDQESFTQSLDLGEVEVLNFGPWIAGRLADVPIGPESAASAQDWAISRADRRIRDDDARRTRIDVRRLFVEVTEDTPLASFGPTLPRHDELLEKYADEPEIYWRLACPVDLGPYPTASEELDSLKVGENEGAPSLQTPEDNEEVVRVWYGERRSMGDLVRRLTGGERTLRALLFDRFVRGAENILSLGLLYHALAERGCSELDVWTGNDADDSALQAIEEVTGRRPRRIGDVVGRFTRLHDRYLVVVPEQSEPFGWWMSNSPLDARMLSHTEPSPDTRLKWRDMLAVRLSSEQLHEKMSAWVDGQII